MNRPDTPRRLLLVDDDTLYCEVMARAIAAQGFDVRTAENHEAAMALLDSFDPTHAVIDLRIGQQSGLELVRALREADNALRIVMLTGYASIATAVEAIKLGAVHYLTKPAEPEDIVAAFERTEGDSSQALAPEPMSVRRLEWEHLQRVLSEHGGNISAAARALGLHRRSLQRKLAKRPAQR